MDGISGATAQATRDGPEPFVCDCGSILYWFRWSCQEKQYGGKARICCAECVPEPPNCFMRLCLAVICDDRVGLAGYLPGNPDHQRRVKQRKIERLFK